MASIQLDLDRPTPILSTDLISTDAKELEAQFADTTAEITHIDSQWKPMKLEVMWINSYI